MSCSQKTTSRPCQWSTLLAKSAGGSKPLIIGNCRMVFDETSCAQLMPINGFGKRKFLQRHPANFYRKMQLQFSIGLVCRRSLPPPQAGPRILECAVNSRSNLLFFAPFRWFCRYIIVDLWQSLHKSYWWSTLFCHFWQDSCWEVLVSFIKRYRKMCRLSPNGWRDIRKRNWCGY